jgi:hypothetical protein
MPKLSFSAEEHEYRMDGRRVPSVTEVLRLAGLYDSYEFTASIHKFRGGSVHHGCALLDMGGSPSIELTPGYAKNPEYVQVAKDIEEGYWPAFVAWKKATGFQGYIWECPFIDPVLGYGGTEDVIGLCNGEVWMPDLKSGGLPSMVCCQTSAYELLLRKGQPTNPDHPGLDWLIEEVLKPGREIKKKGVQLEKTGRWTMVSETSKGDPFDSPKWANLFRSALNLVNVKQQYSL